MVLGCLDAWGLVFIVFFSSRACGKMSPALQQGVSKKKLSTVSSCFFPPRFDLFGVRKTHFLTLHHKKRPRSSKGDEGRLAVAS